MNLTQNARQEIKISVIIPVYNVSGYLRQCVESVCSQSYQNLEIIAVDDGSTDDSGRILEDLAQKDARIQVIHQENQGLSGARNTGICAATGEYIIFLDSDDFWDDAKAVAKLVSRASQSQAEVLNYSYQKYFEDTKVKEKYFDAVPPMPLEKTVGSQAGAYLTSKGLYIASACNKMVKRTLFAPELMFKKGVYSEDIEWCAKLLLRANSMDFVCENFYCYRQRQGSITHAINIKKCNDLCNNILACMHLINKGENAARDSVRRYTAYQYGTFFLVQAQCEKVPEESIAKLAPHRDILKYHSGNKKLLALHWLSKLLGYERTCQLIRFVYKKLRSRR